jgi:hypothetical protein
VSTAPSPTGSVRGAVTAQIAGLSILKGLVLYGATLTFTALYGYFIAKIGAAADGNPPQLDSTMVGAAAALAGVLGSAFAVYIGVPTAADTVNEGLEDQLNSTTGKHWYKDRERFLVHVRRIFSLEPGGKDVASWPLTAGIWTYALVASAVAVAYLLNRAETPEEIKALAIAFGGYVIALVTAAYGVGTKRSP